MYFIQDPFTETVKGPVAADQLRKLYAQGGYEDWGVSKSRSGPWTPLGRVKGIAAAPPPVMPAAAESSVVPIAPVAPEAPLSASTATAAPSNTAKPKSFVGDSGLTVAMDLIRRYFPKSLIGRIGVGVVGMYVVFGVLFGIGVWWSETFGVGARAREAKEAAERQSRKTWQALEDAGGDAFKERTIRDADYERAKQDLGR